MKNERPYLPVGTVCRACLLCFPVIFILLASLPSCRSSRSSMEEREGRVETEKTTQNLTVDIGKTQSDTFHTATASRETQADTILMLADGHDIITLSRDSAGRVVGIDSKHRARVSADRRSVQTAQRWFHGLNATRSSEAATAVERVAQEKKEVKKEARQPVCVSRFLWIAILIIILAYAADLIFRKWKERNNP